MKGAPFDLATLRADYDSGRLTPLDVAREALERVSACSDPSVWISRVPEDDVMARAAVLADSPPASLPLYGVPFAVKDNIDVAGFPTTAGCPAFAYRPSRDAFVVARLIAAGAILMGKTNLDQFATGLSGTRSPYGIPHSVFDQRYISGGSSSGSAVAVSGGLVAFALGTDTAGSGRVPAAFNNIVGLKPTRGLLGMSGIVPACRSLDCVSVFAHTVGDAVQVMHIAEGPDPGDPFSRRPSPRATSSEGFRFGILSPADREFFGDIEAARIYESTIERLASLGGVPVSIDYAPFRKIAALLYEGPWLAERFAAIRGFFTERADSMDPTVRQIISRAASLSAADAFDGQYRLAALRHEADDQWARMEVLLLPTAPTTYTIAEMQAEPVRRNGRLGLYTNFVNLLDCCAVAIPAGFRGDGLPVGVSLIAPAHSDDALAVLADRLHRANQTGMGASRNLPLPEASRIPAPPEQGLPLFVVGAHLSGMPLNHELQSLGAAFIRSARTTADYRFHVLPGTSPPKPGLVRAPDFAGPGIEGEVWHLSSDAFGRFVARIRAPLGIGKVALTDGEQVSGFLCEAYAVAGALEITSHGGWRVYRESIA